MQSIPAFTLLMTLSKLFSDDAYIFKSSMYSKCVTLQAIGFDNL